MKKPSFPGMAFSEDRFAERCRQSSTTPLSDKQDLERDDHPERELEWLTSNPSAPLTEVELGAFITETFDLLEEGNTQGRADL